MIFEIFQNGSDKVNKRLLVLEIAMSQAGLFIAALQGYLPSQDWIPSKYARPIAFGLALFALALHGLQLFFSKTAALYKQTKDGLYDTSFTKKTETSEPTNHES